MLCFFPKSYCLYGVFFFLHTFKQVGRYITFHVHKIRKVKREFCSPDFVFKKSSLAFFYRKTLKHF